MRHHLPLHLLIALAAFAGTSAAAPSRDVERADFLAAESAIAAGETARYEALKARLADYPLLPYLEADALRAQFPDASVEAVRTFLERYADTPLADPLRAAWVDALARRAEWTVLRAAWRPGLGTAADCVHARALLATGDAAGAYAAARALWLVGESQPAACDPLFEAWAGAGKLTPALAWRRFVLAMEAGSYALARYLEPRLRGAEAAAGAVWLALAPDPGRAAEDAATAPAGPYAARVVADVLARHARRDPRRVAGIWEARRGTLPFSAAQQAEVERNLALMLAVDREPLARRYFERVPATAQDATLRAWQVRLHLALGDWQAARAAIEALPPQEAGSSRWQYWRARALDMLDMPGAEAAYAAAASERDFHGFLAAERLDQPAALADAPLQPDPAVQALIAALPGVARARELHLLGRTYPARREWLHALTSRSGAELAQAALLAKQWGWYADAIALAARAGAWNDLALRFPAPYDALVQDAAKDTGLEPAFIYAIMRRESALDPGARSHADARGLMQLLPGTGRRVARRLGEAWRLEHLYEPAPNIRYGSAYFAEQLADFGGHPALAAAAYNAGPHRVRRWLPQAPMPADLWVELIPFGETRDYVAAVLAYAVIYQARAGGPPLRLTEWLPEIPSAARLAAACNRGAGDTGC